MNRKPISVISLSSVLFFPLCIVLFLIHSAFNQQPSFDIIIENGTIIDGTGAGAFASDVGIREDTITAIGDLRASHAGQRIDASGRVVAPGFIDLANHSTDVLQSRPGADDLLRQGITTVLLNSDGGTHREIWPLYTWLHQFELKPAAVNIAAAVAYGTVRRTDSTASSDTLAPADFLPVYEKLTAALQQGAFGISTSLSFGPARYAPSSELAELVRFARDNNVPAFFSLRTPMRQPRTALDEFFALTKDGPVVLSQSQPLPAKIWGHFFSHDSLKRKHVTVFVPPFTRWIGAVTDLVPQGEQFNWREIRRALWMAGGAAHVRIERSQSFPQFAGRSLAFMAQKMQISAQRAFMQLVKDKTALLSFDTISENDLDRLLQSPASIVVSDGGMDISRPGSQAAFPQFLGYFVREKAVLTMEQAIQKITSAPAALIGLHDRGRVQTGAKADIVIFDPERIAADLKKDSLRGYPMGIETVLVNGKIAIDQGISFQTRNGRVLRKNSLPLVTSR